MQSGSPPTGPTSIGHTIWPYPSPPRTIRRGYARAHAVPEAVPAFRQAGWLCVDGAGNAVPYLLFLVLGEVLFEALTGQKPSTPAPDLKGYLSPAAATAAHAAARGLGAVDWGASATTLRNVVQRQQQQ